MAYNPRAQPRKGRWLLHFDDGQRERVDLPDDTVRVMTARVSACRCKASPGGAAGCREDTVYTRTATRRCRTRGRRTRSE